MLKNNWPRKATKELLKEISLNTIQHKKTANKFERKFDLKFAVPESKNKLDTSVSPPEQETLCFLLSLPKELVYSALAYLTPKEILHAVQLTSKQLYLLTQHPYLWKMLNEISPLEFGHKYAKEKKIVERRSKGQLYLARSRFTGTKTVVRKVFLDVANSERDDGVPTSILREVSYLASLNCPRVGTVLEAQVKGRRVLLAYPYYQHNLKEFLHASAKSSHNLPLPTIKVTAKSDPIANNVRTNGGTGLLPQARGAAPEHEAGQRDDQRRRPRGARRLLAESTR